MLFFEIFQYRYILNPFIDIFSLKAALAKGGKGYKL